VAFLCQQKGKNIMFYNSMYILTTIIIIIIIIIVVMISMGWDYVYELRPLLFITEVIY
jgi:hypothetical protein